MSTKMDEKANKGCTFHWKIQNARQIWWKKKGEILKSPIFIAHENMKLSVRLYPNGYNDDKCIGFYLEREEDCCGPNSIKISCQFAFIGEDGSDLKAKLNTSIKKGSYGGYDNFVACRTVTGNEAYLPEDNLTVRCSIFTIDDKPVNTNHIYATTNIKVKRESFMWRIDKVSALKSTMRKRFNDFSIGFDIALNNSLDELEINTIPLKDGIKYISCTTSIIDFEGRKENCKIVKYFASELEKKGPLSFSLLLPKKLMENKSKYFPNDALSFDFEYVTSIVEHSNCRQNCAKLENEGNRKEKYSNTVVLTDDFRSLYIDGIFSDTELRTSTKTFPVHKAILSSRSPVFRGMFSYDMKENRGHVDIMDFDDDTIHRMLLYVYTDSLEDLQFQSASKLYMIADKYQILSLKSKCSSFLKGNLCPTNACDVLVLSLLHNDYDLMSVAEEYILRQQNQFFGSQEWKGFINTHMKLAADIMCKKITNS